MAKSVFDLIKKQNGEHFAKAIRNYDNGIFDVPNIVDIVKYAGREAEPIMSYLVSLKNVSIEEQAVHMNPIDLLDKAGYKAYIVKNLKDQNAIEGYFRNGEKLCTFRDPDRLKHFYIINAVKKECLGDDKLPESEWHIKPSNNPEREDKYGTSVISIQVLKTGGFISIKNRYNHTVNNPDNTLNSNPDNIIHGLADAIKHWFNVDFGAQKVQVPDGYTILNKQVIHYNQEIKGIYFANDFYMENGKIKEINKQTQLMLPRDLMLDVQTKTVKSIAGENKTWADALTKLISNKKIQINKTADGTKEILANGKVVFSINPSNSLFKYLDFGKQTSDLVLGEKYNQLGCNKFFDVNATFDVSGVEQLEISHVDLKNVEIKFNPYAYKVDLREVGALKGNCDFSNVSDLSLYELDCTDADIKFNRNASKVNLCFIRRGSKSGQKFDFGGVRNLYIQNTRFHDDSYIEFNPNAERICVYHDRWSGNILSKDKKVYDFSGVTRELTLSELDFTGKNVQFNPSTEIVRFYCEGLRGVYDFRNVKELSFDLDKVKNVEKFIIGPQTKVRKENRVKVEVAGQVLTQENKQESDIKQSLNEKETLDQQVPSDKIVRTKQESRVDIFKKGILTLQNKIEEVGKKLKEKTSKFGRDNN